MPECIFCKIIAGKSPADIVYQDDKVLAFWDIYPQAPVHVLIVPKEHISSLADVNAEHALLLGHLAVVANQVARSAGILESGYRLAINSGRDSGQVVAHLHLHLLGGRRLGRLG